MERLYLYCIREATGGKTHFSTEGVDAQSTIFCVPYRGLEAVVSLVSSDDFGFADLQTKAQNDLNWIKEKAVLHAKVIDEAMHIDTQIVSLVPMRFGSIFKNISSLADLLSKDYDLLVDVLTRNRGTQEWSLKVYLTNIAKLEQIVKAENAVIHAKVKEISTMPAGMGYFMETELQDLIKKEADRELSQLLHNIQVKLRSLAVNSVKCKNLGKEITGRKEPMMLNIAYQIAMEHVDTFLQAIDQANQTALSRGFALEYSGPWPAYNFTSYYLKDNALRGLAQ
jgi:hypothetical protein